MLASAPGHHSRLLDLHFLWFKTGAFMRTVAKRLALRTTTGAPPVFAGFDFLHDRRFLKDSRFVHARVLFTANCAAIIRLIRRTRNLAQLRKSRMVGAVRFELTTSCTRNKRASQATLRPDPGRQKVPGLAAFCKLPFVTFQYAYFRLGWILSCKPK